MQSVRVCFKNNLMSSKLRCVELLIAGGASVSADVSVIYTTLKPLLATISTARDLLCTSITASSEEEVDLSICLCGSTPDSERAVDGIAACGGRRVGCI